MRVRVGENHSQIPGRGARVLGLAHLGAGGAGLGAVGLPLALGFLLGAPEIVAAPAFEPVVTRRDSSASQVGGDRPNDRAAVRSVRSNCTSRRLPSATAVAIVRKVVLTPR